MIIKILYDFCMDMIVICFKKFYNMIGWIFWSSSCILKYICMYVIYRMKDKYLILKYRNIVDLGLKGIVWKMNIVISKKYLFVIF